MNPDDAAFLDSVLREIVQRLTSVQQNADLALKILAARQTIAERTRDKALAHHWRGLIQSGVVRDQADLARLVGVSRARVTQVLRLLDLAPDLQEAVLDGMVDGPGVERVLRATASIPVWQEQRKRRAQFAGE